MDLGDIRQLIATGNPKLVLHAISAWEREHSHQPEPIIDALKSSDTAVLEAALKAVSVHHPKICAPYVASLMSSEDSSIRRLAVQWALPAMGKSVVDALKQLFQTEADVFVLSLAVTAGAGLNIGIEYIEPLLEHEDVRVRANAVKAVALMGGDRTRKLLEPKLKDSAIRVQNEALKALASMVPATELEKLIVTRLHSSDAAVRAATAFVTGELPLAGKVEMLCSVLNDAEPQVVKCAARALCALEDKTGVKAVSEAFLKMPLSSIESEIASDIAAADAGVFIRTLSGAETEGLSRDRLVRKAILVAGHSEDLFLFNSWIQSALEVKDTEIRISALKMVVKALSNHKTEISQIVERAERSSNPEEMALGALIKWRSGQLTGFSQLKTMLYSGKAPEAKAAADILVFDNGLIARRLLHEAQMAGIIQGPPAQKPGEDFEQPISLPID